MATDPRMELARFEAMTSSFDAYLDGDAPYREVTVENAGGGSQTATMSIGLLLDLLDDLDGDEAALAPEERARFAEARRGFDALRHGRGADYRRLLIRELKGQVDAWRWYLDDCQRGERGAEGAYASEARKRTRIEQLAAEAQALGVDIREIARRVDDLDRTLRGMLRPGPYCGPHGREAALPRERYWWLYGRPEVPASDA